jgi:uncharacterized membrane protein
MTKSILTKSSAFGMFFIFLGAQAVAQRTFSQQDPEKQLYFVKAEKFRRMNNAGTTLTFLGTTLAIIGVVTLLNSSETTTYNGSIAQKRTTGNPEGGAAAVLIGTAAAGIGVPLWIIGGVNEGRYRRKYEAVTVGASILPQHAGLTLRYRF